MRTCTCAHTHSHSPSRTKKKHRNASTNTHQTFQWAPARALCASEHPDWRRAGTCCHRVRWGAGFPCLRRRGGWRGAAECCCHPPGSWPTPGNTWSGPTPGDDGSHLSNCSSALSTHCQWPVSNIKGNVTRGDNCTHFAVYICCLIHVILSAVKKRREKNKNEKNLWTLYCV